MGFKTWLLGLLDGKNAQKKHTDTIASGSLPYVSDPLEEEAAGLNFRTAIESHQKWKTRLQAVIDANSQELLSVDVISRDDQCALGKWIHGLGGALFSSDELFRKLQEDHALFHACAGRVLHAAQAGDRANSTTELKSGDYARVSQELLLDLAQLYAKANEMPKQ